MVWTQTRSGNSSRSAFANTCASRKRCSGRLVSDSSRDRAWHRVSQQAGRSRACRGRGQRAARRRRWPRLCAATRDFRSNARAGQRGGCAPDGARGACRGSRQHDGVRYEFDDTRPDARIARLMVNDAVQRGAGRADLLPITEQQVRERGSRYIDFVVPGLLGMTIMGGGIWGLGYSIVDQRRKNLLKRLVATPMSRAEYLASYVISRFVLLLSKPAYCSAVGAVVRVPMRGSLFALPHRHRRAPCRSADRAAHRIAVQDDRRRVGADEPDDAAHVGALGRVLFVGEFSPARFSR